MGVLILMVSFVVTVTTVNCNECVDSGCFNTNSSNIKGGVVISHGCAHTGNKLYQCTLSIMVTSDTSGNNEGCVAIGNVPGIHQFCNSFLIEQQPPQAPPVTYDDDGDIDDITTEITTTTPEDKAKILSNEYITCIETEVLVGVAIGSFVLGCFVTWAFITVLAQCKALQKELRDVQTSNTSRSRTNFEMGSTSIHQRLLSNGSAESYPSSILCGQHNGNLRRQSEDTRLDNGVNSGRHFQMRQPLPAPPMHEVNVQPYYALPIDSLYTCVSDKDYQSIQGGSEHYAPVGEGSDYTSLKSQRVTIVREGDSSRQTRESAGANDYCSLKSERVNKDESAIYSPASDGSNRDYSSLADDVDGDNHGGIVPCDEPVSRSNAPAAVKNEVNSDQVKFQVNGFVGFGAPKRIERSTKTAPEQRGSIPDVLASGADASDTESKVKDNVNEMTDGYEVVQNNTLPFTDKIKPGLVNGDGNQNPSISSKSNNANNVDMNDTHDGVITGSFASLDEHDYDTCNGSIHDYYVLEEPSTNV